MSMAFNIIKKACALKILETGLTDGEALYRAIFDYNPYLMDKVVNAKCDPRESVDDCILVRNLSSCLKLSGPRLRSTGKSDSGPRCSQEAF